MSIGVEQAYFGDGGTRPYDRTLRGGGTLILREVAPAAVGPNRVPGADLALETVMDVGRYAAAADAADLSVIDACDGAVIDLGCGPGRMVHAAILRGRFALGIDVSAAAVAMAHSAGLPVLRRDLTDELPLEGQWGTALLIDGNIGIGGNPARLLARTRSLIASEGLIIVEAHTDPLRERHCLAEVSDRFGQSSDPFPWSQIGVEPLRRIAAEMGLSVDRTWTCEPSSSGASETRTFVALRA